MLPSLVVEEVRHGVAESLRAQFEPSTELYKDAIRRLIDQPHWICAAGHALCCRL